MKQVELCDPHYMGWEVFFGYLANSNIGMLAPLSNEIVIRKWLQENVPPSFIMVQGHRVVFTEKDDATLCYLAFR